MTDWVSSCNGPSACVEIRSYAGYVLARAGVDPCTTLVHLHAVDTGSDQYAVVIADRPLDDARAVYERVVSDG